MSHLTMMSSMLPTKLGESEEINQLVRQAKESEQLIDQNIEEVRRLLPEFKKAVQTFKQDRTIDDLQECERHMRKRFVELIRFECDSNTLNDMQQFTDWLLEKCHEKRLEEEEMQKKKDSLIKQKELSCEQLNEAKERLESLKNEYETIKRLSREDRKSLNLLVHVLDLAFRNSDPNVRITVGMCLSPNQIFSFFNGN